MPEVTLNTDDAELRERIKRAVVNAIGQGASFDAIGADVISVLSSVALEPAEPDDGAVISWVSDNDEVWVARRADDCATDENNWLVGAEGELRSWSWLLARGSASAVRLWTAAELIPDPDPDWVETDQLCIDAGMSPHTHRHAVAAVCLALRARAESRVPTGGTDRNGEGDA
jgi:hypothetical protein